MRIRRSGATITAVAMLLSTAVVASANPQPAPEDLWRPAAGATPEGGTYVYLESTPGDYVGAGNHYLYTPDTAVLSVSHDSGVVTVWVDGQEKWSYNNFAGPDAMTSLAPGYYGDLQRYPFHNPAEGGLDWSGEGRGCNKLYGWFVVDDIEFVGGEMTRLLLRFEQHCETIDAPPLRGEIRFEKGTEVGEPQNPRPVPDDLWRPAPGATPSTETYIYLESGSLDGTTARETVIFTPENAVLWAAHRSGWIDVQVDGDVRWDASFAAPRGIERLEPGFYDELQRYPFHNPMYGGLTWSWGQRGCNESHVWFVIDEIVFEHDTMTSLRVRFGQVCENEDGVPFHGEIRFTGEFPAPAESTDDGTPPEGRYSDVEGHTHAAGIEAVSAEGIAGGYADGTYRPDVAVTRGQMATFLARALQLPPPDASSPTFRDTGGHIHEDAIRSVVEAGVAGGYPDGTYRPNAPVTRDQMATFLARGFDLPAARTDAPDYDDIQGNEHEHNIRAVAQAGITSGYPDGTYRPRAVVTRGQMATFLARALGLI